MGRERGVGSPERAGVVVMTRGTGWTWVFGFSCPRRLLSPTFLAAGRDSGCCLGWGGTLGEREAGGVYSLLPLCLLAKAEASDTPN